MRLQNSVWRPPTNLATVWSKTLKRGSFGEGGAIERLRKDAEQGDVSADLALGMAYELGTGVKANKQAALSWYQKAAEQDGPLKRMAQFDVARVVGAIKGDTDGGGK